jgi:hypothetical protein
VKAELDGGLFHPRKGELNRAKLATLMAAGELKNSAEQTHPIR